MQPLVTRAATAIHEICSTPSRVSKGGTVTLCTMLFAASFACAPISNEGIDDGLTSVPSDQVGGGNNNDDDRGNTTPNTDNGNPPSSGGNTVAPNPGQSNGVVTQPNTGNSNEPVVSLPPPNPAAIYGVGFALAAVDYPGLCLESTDATNAAGSGLHLAQCANVPAQAFGFYKGHIALDKRVCIAGGTSNGTAATLQTCRGAEATQTWQLGPDKLLSRILPSTTIVQALSIPASTYTTARVATSLPSDSSALRLMLVPMVKTDGVRIHGVVGGTDLCMADAAGVAKFTTCNAGPEQVWYMVYDQWRSALGNCLIGDVTNRTVSVGACSVPASANARWYLYGNYVALMAPSATPSASAVVMSIDTTNKVLNLSTASATPAVFGIGCPTITAFSF